MIGILYFNEIHNLFHDCYEDFVEKHLLPRSQWFRHPEWAVPIKKIESEFLKPLMAFENYQVKMDVARIGTSSFTLTTQFTKDEDVFATVTSTHVFIDPKKQSAISIPPEIKDQLKTL